MSTEEQVAELRQRIDDLEAIGALEAKLVEMKESGKNDPDNEEWRSVKNDLRERRSSYRGAQPTLSPEDQPTVSPDTIEASLKEED